jgi:DNA mismatch repair protein MutS
MGLTYHHDSTYAEDAYVWMDFTIRNLELYHSYNPNAVTLLDVIDKTLSPMGGRLWLALPLKDNKNDAMRLSTIYKKTRKCCKNANKTNSDLERLISKIIWKSVATRSGLFERIIRCYPIKTWALESPKR